MEVDQQKFSESKQQNCQSRMVENRANYFAFSVKNPPMILHL